MSLDASTLWCNRCQRNVGHVRQGLRHGLHLAASILTGGVWLIFWAAFALRGDALGWYCLGCGEPYTRPRVDAEDSPD